MTSAVVPPASCPRRAPGDGRLVAIAEALFWRLYTVLGSRRSPVLAILGLSEVPLLADKFRELFRWDENRDLLQAVEQIADRCCEYIGVTVLTSLITGVASGLWALAVGLDLARMWGVLNFLLNFVVWDAGCGDDREDPAPVLSGRKRSRRSAGS